MYVSSREFPQFIANFTPTESSEELHIATVQTLNAESQSFHLEGRPKLCYISGVVMLIVVIVTMLYFSVRKRNTF